MSALQDSLAGPPPAIFRGTDCTVAQLLARLTPDERDAITSALKRGWTYTDIAKRLKAAGHHMTPGTLSRHYSRRVCRCHST